LKGLEPDFLGDVLDSLSGRVSGGRGKTPANAFGRAARSWRWLLQHRGDEFRVGPVHPSVPVMPNAARSQREFGDDGGDFGRLFRQLGASFSESGFVADQFHAA